jgi:hypothetical protein
MLRNFVLCLATVGACIGLATPASAQYQALALVDSNGAVELACHGRTCGAEFSSFCLQPELGTPTPEVRYDPASVAHIRLTGLTRDGREISLDPAQELRFRAIRTHVTVRVSMDRARFHELNLASLKLEVGPEVALLPETMPGKLPLSAGQIAAITGSLRPLGSEVVDHSGARMTALRLMSRMINTLPPGGRENEAEREAIWRQSFRPADLAGVPAPALEQVRHARDFCAAGSADATQPSMRGCLQSLHDSGMGALNNDYWARLKNGS